MESIIIDLLNEGKISANDVRKIYLKIKDEEILDRRLKALEDINKITIRWDVPIKYTKVLNKSYDGITIPLSLNMKELIIEELKKEIECQ